LVRKTDRLLAQVVQKQACLLHCVGKVLKEEVLI
jgi:hypothetical protein